MFAGAGQVVVWRHEAHHRGQLYLMLALRGVKTPPIYELTEEEVAARGAQQL